MENATDALYIAFAVIIFVIALTITMVMFSRLGEVSGVAISSSDITEFYEYEGADINKANRTVGLETIIPTLYKYYKENYTVIFLKKDGTPLGLYNSETNRDLWGNGTNDNTGNIGKYYSSNSDYEKVCSFDVDEEITRHEPWTGTTEDYKNNLDAFLKGGKFNYPSDPSQVAYDYSRQLNNNGGFIGLCATNNYKFKEMLGEYNYNVETEGHESALLKNRKKRVIIYQLQS